MTPWRTLMLMVGLGLGACTGDARPASHGATLEVGTGIERFVELEDGAEVVFGEGAQGGYHIWVSLLTSGLIPQGLEVRLTTQLYRSRGPVQWTDLVLDMERVADSDRYQTLALQAVLSYPECHVDREVQITAEAVDLEGSTAFAEQLVTARHPASFPPCRFE